jgi:alpha-1,2-mannosyltransferase
LSGEAGALEPPDPYAAAVPILTTGMGISTARRQPRIGSSGSRNEARTVVAIAAITGVAFALRPHPPVDLAVYLRAGQRFVADGVLYGPLWGVSLERPLPYTYPPLWASVMSVAGWLPWRVAAAAWAGLNVWLLVWIVRTSFARFLERRNEGALAWLVLLGMAIAPIAATLWFGQLGIVLTAAVMADTLPRDQRRLPRGVLVGAAAAVKLTPSIFIVYWAITGRRKEALRAVGTALALTLAAAVVRPAASDAFWTSTVFDTSRVGDVAAVVNQSLRGALLRADVPATLAWIALAAAVTWIGLRRARRAHRSGDELAAITLVGLAGLAISPVSWIHHAVWIVPSIGLTLGDGRSTGRRRAAIALTVLFLLRVPDWTADLSLGGPAALLFGNAYQLAYVALLAWLPIDERRAVNAEEPAAEPEPAAEAGAAA